MITGLYTAMFVLSLAMLVIQTLFFKKNISPYYSLLFAAVTVSNLGYLQLASSETLEAALSANQLKRVLADVFDALVSKRVYKESMDFDQAFAIIEESSGSHFDPTLCHEFLECRPEFEKLYASYED